MTISNVQSVAAGQSAAGTSISATVAAIGSGSLVCGFVFWHSSTATDWSSVTDNAGNTYTIVDKVTSAGNNRGFGSFYLPNITNGPITITANFAASLVNIGIFVGEYSGVAATAPLDGHAAQIQTSPGSATDAVTSGNIVTANNGDLIFGCGVDITGLAGINAGTGFTVRINGNGSTGSFVTTEDKLQLTAGTVAATLTLGGVTNDTFAGAMAFSPVGGGGGSSSNTLMGAACL